MPCASAPGRRQAADYLLASPGLNKDRFRGVCFYDESARGFVILDRATQQCLPREASPIRERDTFALYDDARCRGADLKLRPGAKGLLTLGPGICKDKVMQVRRDTQWEGCDPYSWASRWFVCGNG